MMKAIHVASVVPSRVARPIHHAPSTAAAPLKIDGKRIHGSTPSGNAHQLSSDCSG